MKAVKRLIEKEPFMAALLIALGVLAVLYPGKIAFYPSFVEWETIIALTGLLIIITGLKESGYFFFFSRNLLNRARSERGLAFLLILLSAFLSTFLTNDIALFLVVPITLAMKDLIKNDISRLVIFEAISVNVGSALTPIGNPQNLFLWHEWGISFIGFITRMLPAVIVLMAVLLAFVWLFFPDREISFSEMVEGDASPRRELFILSAFLLTVYLFSLEAGRAAIVLPVVFALYLIFYRKVLLKTDWMLLLTFVIIFIVFHIVATVPFITNSLQSVNNGSSGAVFLISAVASQLISNVPASVFVSNFSRDWFAITCGVNVAGNGLFIASLANIIALRFVRERKVWLDFHRYSVPYLIISGAIVYLLFFVL